MSSQTTNNCVNNFNNNLNTYCVDIATTENIIIIEHRSIFYILSKNNKIDNILLKKNNTILVKNQISHIFNNIYKITEQTYNNQQSIYINTISIQTNNISNETVFYIKNGDLNNTKYFSQYNHNSVVNNPYKIYLPFDNKLSKITLKQDFSHLYIFRNINSLYSTRFYYFYNSKIIDNHYI